jgi:hypothetical protein
MLCCGHHRPHLAAALTAAYSGPEPGPCADWGGGGLRVLSLEGNPGVDDAAIHALLGAVRAGGMATSCSPAPPPGPAAQVQLPLPVFRLQRLDLSRTAVTGAALPGLAAALPHLTHLWLTGCRLGPEGGRAIARLLQQRCHAVHCAPQHQQLDTGPVPPANLSSEAEWHEQERSFVRDRTEVGEQRAVSCSSVGFGHCLRELGLSATGLDANSLAAIFAALGLQAAAAPAVDGAAASRAAAAASSSPSVRGAAPHLASLELAGNPGCEGSGGDSGAQGGDSGELAAEFKMEECVAALRAVRPALVVHWRADPGVAALRRS